MSTTCSLLDLMPADAMVVSARAHDWRAAIQLAGDALVSGGITTPDYTGEMVRTVEELGPYIVIAPGLALAHSRPSPAVLRTGLSWVGLAEPVEFGSKSNDPVHLVIGLAARDHESHLTAMTQLARLVSDGRRLEALAALDNVSAVRESISTFERTQQ
ncbi:PTS sugar transporter subunit IIA [Actinomyces provencensis]|uniref:PTS sugar transporter subunit IIA n=1 Tax=Actinomyces provencensis TaxID=1720198 RepID=UPI00096A6C29|nr:PTS sugar transporter subunit IIA [Actinomyces provencensis]